MDSSLCFIMVLLQFIFFAAPRGLGTYFTGSAGDSLRIAVHWLNGLPAQIGQPQRCFPVRLLTTARHV